MTPHLRQDRIYEELCGKFGDQIDIEPNANALGELPYLEKCIKETLRKFSVLPVVVRRAPEDITPSGKINMISKCYKAIALFLFNLIPVYRYGDTVRSECNVAV